MNILLLKTILDHICSYETLDDRANAILDMASEYPILESYFRECFAPTKSYKKVLSLKPFTIRPINSFETEWTSILEEILAYDDSSIMKPYIRRSKIIQLLDCLTKEDAELINDMLSAKYNYNDKINTLLVKTVYPSFFDSKNV